MAPTRAQLINRILSAAIAALLLAGVVAGSVSATNGTRKGSTTTISLAATCRFTVTYAWHGFGGKVMPEVGLVRRTGTNLDVGIAYASGPASSGKSGSFSYTFTLTAGTGAYLYTAVGRLTTSRNPEISGSKSTPGGYINGGTCGDPVIP